jgi:hypothetical protein
MIALSFFSAGAVQSKRLSFRGEASATATINEVAPRSTYLSGRYLPEVFMETSLPRGRTLDALVSMNAKATVQVTSLEETESDAQGELYRGWLRYGANQFESRIGLQKIAFGSATLLRPLMWFDRLDPRDPLQITDGVYALLMRYYLLSNANIWFWGLIGNDETKGWELLPTTSDDPEIGARLQIPTGPGEAAFSYHHRQVDLVPLIPPGAPNAESSTPEHRFALDGKWDVHVGLWFEAVLIHQRSELLSRPYRRLMVVGSDYTFGLGEGLTVLGEQFVTDSSERAFGSGDGFSTSAFSTRYRWGVVDELSAIFYYDWDQNHAFRFATWRRTYDRWAFHLILFANPRESGSTPVQPSSDLLAGSGVQVLISFNH